MAKLSWMNHAEEFLSADRDGAPNTKTDRRVPAGNASMGRRESRDQQCDKGDKSPLQAPHCTVIEVINPRSRHRVRPWGQHRAAGSAQPEQDEHRDR